MFNQLRILMMSLSLVGSLFAEDPSTFVELEVNRTQNEKGRVKDLEYQVSEDSNGSVSMESSELQKANKTERSYFVNLGVQTHKNEDFKIDLESGEVELKWHQVRLGIGKKFKLSNATLKSTVCVGWSSMELEYNQGLGILKLKPDLTYGFNLSLDFLNVNGHRLALMADVEGGRFKGNEFRDRLNVRNGIPFDATVDLLKYKTGFTWEKELISSNFPFLLGSSLYYNNANMDMSTGWSTNSAVEMAAKDHVGASFSVSPIFKTSLQSKLEVMVGNVLGAGLTLSYSY